MLTVKRATRGFADLDRIEALYTRAFPENERRDFTTMVNDGEGALELFACYDGDEFCGFVCLLNNGDISHIIYFAVEEDMRDRGYGSGILAAVHEMKKGYRVIVDIEREVDGADNNDQRRRRKQFYIRNGYAETEVRYRWEHEEYEILSYGGNVTDEEFGNFWRTLDRRDAAAGV